MGPSNRKDKGAATAATAAAARAKANRCFSSFQRPNPAGPKRRPWFRPKGGTHRVFPLEALQHDVFVVCFLGHQVNLGMADERREP